MTWVERCDVGGKVCDVGGKLCDDVGGKVCGWKGV